MVGWAILQPVCATVGDITVREWYNGRYYSQRVEQLAILMSLYGSLGDITIRVH